jgi:acyl transferase domain-containing protein
MVSTYGAQLGELHYHLCLLDKGAQWAGMDKELLHTYPVFWESISRIDRYLAELGTPFYVSA